MPIRPELKPLYGADWAALSRQIRFGRAKGRCERCQRPHGLVTHRLPDGRWFDAESNCWWTQEGKPTAWPDLFEAQSAKTSRLWLATAHLDHNPANNDPSNLAALCPICHLAHDRAMHRMQFRHTILLRRALGDLFLGPYSRTLAVDGRVVEQNPAPAVVGPVPKWHEQRNRGLSMVVTPTTSRPGTSRYLH